MIETFKRLPYHLKIAGKGPLKDYIEEATLEIKNVSYLGVLSKDQVYLELEKAEALIFPSIWAETFGLVITEAFSNSCAVIASAIGAPKSIVVNEYNGLLFESNNSVSLVKAIEKWKNLPLTSKALIRQNAYNSFINNYSEEIQPKYFEDIFNEVLQRELCLN